MNLCFSTMALTRLLVTAFFLSVVNAKLVRQSDEVRNELEEYVQNKKAEINPRYRLHYHVMPPVGWMNDPNGFSFYKGEYHIFYQYYPYDSIWGPMHWGHSSSPDLVNWKELPTALIPEEEMCFSGSAVVDGESLILIYTGRINLEGDNYNESQYLAVSDDGINFYKHVGNPVLALPSGGSPDFRDPKVWKHGDYYYVVIGTTTNNQQTGRVVLYRSSDLISWEYLSVIGESGDDLGYMWECPDFFELDGKFVLLMSPQGVEPQGDRYKNLYQTGYIIGSFDYETFQFVPEVDFQELDYGHDFYASQTMEHDGKRYVLGWFSMWEQPHPEKDDGWSGALTMVREIKLVDNRILMSPVEAMKQLRNDTVLIGDFNEGQVLSFDNTAEIIVEGDLEYKIELLIEGRNGGDQALITWDPAVGKVAIDRGSDDVRQVEWSPIGSKSWRLFLDTSSLELFCGEGEVVFSSRLYVEDPWNVINLSPQSLKIESWHLKRSVPES
ncbi:sucrose-6-phosphate hydrolase-like [Amyelois transitella]|uniref:sucrose-6-phosphate hydrolase-like n=1 Tax=Amyelois transitella TaxID=680683 RepID=UPI0029905A14|nr:sucrose-6-phosphate hydrolase-like [Amyelois transitella]